MSSYVRTSVQHMSPIDEIPDITTLIPEHAAVQSAYVEGLGTKKHCSTTSQPSSHDDEGIPADAWRLVDFCQRVRSERRQRLSDQRLEKSSKPNVASVSSLITPAVEVDADGASDNDKTKMLALPKLEEAPVVGIAAVSQEVGSPQGVSVIQHNAASQMASSPQQGSFSQGTPIPQVILATERDHALQFESNFILANALDNLARLIIACCFVMVLPLWGSCLVGTLLLILIKSEQYTLPEPYLEVYEYNKLTENLVKDRTSLLTTATSVARIVAVVIFSGSYGEPHEEILRIVAVAIALLTIIIRATQELSEFQDASQHRIESYDAIYESSEEEPAAIEPIPVKSAPVKAAPIEAIAVETVGWSVAHKDLHSKVQSLEFISSGNSYKVYLLNFQPDSITKNEVRDDPTQIPDKLILKIGSSKQGQEASKLLVRNEVAIRNFLTLNCSEDIPVPDIYLWNDGADKNMPIYVVEGFVSGTTMDESLRKDKRTDEGFAVMMNHLSEILFSLANQRFSMIGGLDPDFHGVTPMIEAVHPAWVNHNLFQASEYDLGPFRNTKEYIVAAIERKIAMYSNLMWPGLNNKIDRRQQLESQRILKELGWGKDYSNNYGLIDQYVQFLREKRQQVEGKTDLGASNRFAISHGDITGRNIMVDGNKVVAILGWKWADTLPVDEFLAHSSRGTTEIDFLCFGSEEDSNPQGTIEEDFAEYSEKNRAYTKRLRKLLGKHAKTAGWSTKDTEALVRDRYIRALHFARTISMPHHMEGDDQAEYQAYLRSTSASINGHPQSEDKNGNEDTGGGEASGVNNAQVIKPQMIQTTVLSSDFDNEDESEDKDEAEGAIEAEAVEPRMTDGTALANSVPDEPDGGTAIKVSAAATANDTDSDTRECETASLNEAIISSIKTSAGIAIGDSSNGAVVGTTENALESTENDDADQGIAFPFDHSDNEKARSALVEQPESSPAIRDDSSLNIATDLPHAVSPGPVSRLSSSITSKDNEENLVVASHPADPGEKVNTKTEVRPGTELGSSCHSAPETTAPGTLVGPDIERNIDTLKAFDAQESKKATVGPSPDLQNSIALPSAASLLDQASTNALIEAKQIARNNERSPSLVGPIKIAPGGLNDEEAESVTSESKTKGGESAPTVSAPVVERLDESENTPGSKAVRRHILKAKGRNSTIDTTAAAKPNFLVFGLGKPAEFGLADNVNPLPSHPENVGKPKSKFFLEGKPIMPVSPSPQRHQPPAPVVSGETEMAVPQPTTSLLDVMPLVDRSALCRTGFESGLDTLYAKNAFVISDNKPAEGSATSFAFGTPAPDDSSFAFEAPKFRVLNGSSPITVAGGPSTASPLTFGLEKTGPGPISFGLPTPKAAPLSPPSTPSTEGFPILTEPTPELNISASLDIPKEIWDRLREKALKKAAEKIRKEAEEVASKTARKAEKRAATAALQAQRAPQGIPEPKSNPASPAPASGLTAEQRAKRNAKKREQAKNKKAREKSEKQQVVNVDG